jgi:hypothetical protein
VKELMLDLNMKLEIIYLCEVAALKKLNRKMAWINFFVVIYSIEEEKMLCILTN